MIKIAIIVQLLLFQLISFAQWDPDAGLVEPYTNNAVVEVSSGPNVAAITDGDPNTFWESYSPLPDKYISRRDLNIFLNSTLYYLDKSNQFATNATDGILSSKSEIYSGNFEVRFIAAQTIKQLSFKFNTQESIKITIETEKSTFDYYYTIENNYGLVEVPITNGEKVRSIKMESIDSFEIFEIAGLYKLPTEEVVFDLGENKNVGTIGSRHFNGDGVEAISVFVSTDKNNWKEVAKLNPKATTFITEVISPPIFARYVKVSFTLKSRKYQKAKLHEFVVYDSYGPFGKPKKHKPAKRTYGESFGINAIWGWGYSVPTVKLTGDTGPNLFNKVAKLARNYHGLSWDIEKPGQNPNYQDMELGKGTKAKSWVNWHSEYNSWIDTGFKIDACIMFNNQHFNDSMWVNTVNEAYDFGRYFGSYFSKKTKLISVFEIGNEPWEYSKSVYRDILKGMSMGINESSKDAIVLPCANQSFTRVNELDNYISKYVNRDNSSNISGLNTHIYSYANDYDGQKMAINPEDRRSEVWSVVNMQRFSDKNLNSIPVYVTEYGYDSHGGGDDCTHSVCISELEQAIYGVRMSLILYRLGVEEFYWYYFANVDYLSIMHNRAGLLSSYSKGFTKKDAFNSFEILQNELGDYYFHDIIYEGDDAWIYTYADSSGDVKRIIAWRPTTDNHQESKWVEFPCSYVIEGAVSVVSDESKSSTPSYVRTVNKLKINLSGVPVIIKVK